MSEIEHELDDDLTIAAEASEIEEIRRRAAEIRQGEAAVPSRDRTGSGYAEVSDSAPAVTIWSADGRPGPAPTSTDGSPPAATASVRPSSASTAAAASVRPASAASVRSGSAEGAPTAGAAAASVRPGRPNPPSQTSMAADPDSDTTRIVGVAPPTGLGAADPFAAVESEAFTAGVARRVPRTWVLGAAAFVALVALAVYLIMSGA